MADNTARITEAHVAIVGSMLLYLLPVSFVGFPNLGTQEVISAKIGGPQYRH